MYDINAKTLNVDYDNPKKMFFQSNNLEGFKHYRIFVETSQNGQTVMMTPYYFLTHPSKNEVIYVNPWSMVIHNRVINYFKFTGSNCEKFLNYLDKVADKSSKEYATFKQDKKDNNKANKAESKLRKAEAKRNKKIKVSYEERMERMERIRNHSAQPYEFYFNYFYQKYLDCSCEPRKINSIFGVKYIL